MRNLHIINEEELKPLVVAKLNNIDKPIRLHFHQNYEISFILEGGHEYHIGHKTYSINDFDLFVVNKNQVHTASSLPGKPMTRFSVKFLPSLVQPFFDSADLLSLFNEAGRRHSNKIIIPQDRREWLIAQFEKMLDQSAYAWEVKRKLILCEIIIFLNKTIKNKFDFPENHQDPSPFNELIDFIISNIATDLSLDQLARFAGISKYHLARQFKERFGISIYQYILTQRIGKAVLLLEKGKNINEISDLTGFNTYSNFIAAFKKIKGLPPLQFKRQILKMD
ncbi:MAG: AraC family transcriptional regulator [Cytophagales bacterium]|nr:AraC family transcriptional regulator [Cytophagales bacterium]